MRKCVSDAIKRRTAIATLSTFLDQTMDQLPAVHREFHPGFIRRLQRENALAGRTLFVMPCCLDKNQFYSLMAWSAERVFEKHGASLIPYRQIELLFCIVFANGTEVFHQVMMEWCDSMKLSNRLLPCEYMRTANKLFNGTSSRQEFYRFMFSKTREIHVGTIVWSLVVLY
jgi:hypothetical protein